MALRPIRTAVIVFWPGIENLPAATATSTALERTGAPRRRPSGDGDDLRGLAVLMARHLNGSRADLARLGRAVDKKRCPQVQPSTRRRPLPLAITGRERR